MVEILVFAALSIAFVWAFTQQHDFAATAIALTAGAILLI